MRFRLPHLLLKAIVLSFSAAASYTVQAAYMFDSVGVEAHRDFALNVGIFEKGATNVQIYNQDGTLRGSIPVMPDFGALTDPYWGSYAALGGGQSWVLDVEHNYAPSSVSFSDKYGAKDTPVMEDYRVVKHVNDYNPHNSYGDLRTTRLSKVVTDVVHLELPTLEDTYYKSVEGFGNWHLYRAGSGRQGLINEETGEIIFTHAEYGYFTGGTVEWVSEVGDDNFRRDVVVHDGRSYDENGDPILVTLKNYTFYSGNIAEADAEQSPMPLHPLSGDSGSPTIVFNETTQSFQYLGGASRSSEWYTGSYNTFVSPEFHHYIINSSSVTLDAAETTWVVEDLDENGFVSLKGADGTLKMIRVLKQNERGDTSTIGTAASDDEMWATLDWILDNGQATLDFATTIDTGAGTLQFRRAENTSASNLAKYTLTSTTSSAETPIALSTGGYIIQEHVEVTTYLTGRVGDEWRIVGENARMKDDLYDIYGGSFTIKGTGNNEANLDLGVGVSVFLDREDGYAANNVQINTGAKVYLVKDNQINGLIAFGNDGGTLHLNGRDLNRNADNLYALDRDAQIVNVMVDTISSLTYNYGVDESLKISFLDGSALATKNNAKLNLNFIATGADSHLNLSNTIHTSGDLLVQGGELTIQGYMVPHAKRPTLSGSEDEVFIYDENDWAGISVDVNKINVTNAAHLHLSSYSTTTATQLDITAGSKLDVYEHATLNSDVLLQGTAYFHQGSQFNGHMTVDAGATLTTDSIFTSTVIVPPAVEGGESTSLTSPRAVGITVEDGASALFLQDIYLTSGSSNAGHMDARGDLRLDGNFTNTGTLELHGSLTLNQYIENTGTLFFSESVRLDINDLTSVYDELNETTSYRIFLGGVSDSFSNLTSSNILLDGGDGLSWTFSADGVITSSGLFRVLEYNAGSTLYLENNATGFVSGIYENRASINFTTQDATLDIIESGLSTQRILVQGVELNILSTAGHLLSVDKLELESNSTLKLTGDILSAQTNIIHTEGATGVKIILDMQGLTIEDKRWLLGYDDHLELQNGTYHWGDSAYGLRELSLAADGQLVVDLQPEIVGTEASFDTYLTGSGTLSVNHNDTIDFTQIADFTGRIDTPATTINFREATGASIELQEQSSLNLTVTGSYTGDLSGAGSIYVQQNNTIVSGLNGFEGTLYQQGSTVSLGGVSTEMTRLSLLGSGTLNILGDSHIKTSDVYKRELTTNTIYNIASGSHLEETGVQLALIRDTFRLSGGGTLSVEGFSFAYVKGIAYIEADTTLNIVGTSSGGTGSGQGDFQIGLYDYHQEMHVYGTLSSNAGISNYYGKGSIFVYDGGTLELKKGGEYSSAFSDRFAYIHAYEGSTLILGQQSNLSIDHGGATNAKRLDITLHSGSTLAASGSGTITVPHSLIWSEEGSYTIESGSGQDFVLTKEVLANQLNITGAGQTQLSQLRANGLNISNVSSLSLSQSELALTNIQLDGQLTLNSVSDYSASLGAVSGAGSLHAQDSTGSMNIADLGDFSGSLHFGSGSLYVGMGHVTAQLEISGNSAEVELAAGVRWENNAEETTRSGDSYRMSLGTGAQLNEGNVNYNLGEGSSMEITGGGRYEAGALAVNNSSLILGDNTQSTFSSLNMAATQVELGAASLLNITGNSSIQAGTSQIVGLAGSQLVTQQFSLAAGADLTLSGPMSLQTSGNTISISQGATLRMQNGIASAADFIVAGSFIADRSVELTGHISTSASNAGGTNLLDFSAGGLIAADITVNTGGSAIFGDVLTLTGQVTNSGTIDLSGSLTLSSSIINSGTLNFNSILLDISNLESTTDGSETIYQIFTGGSSDSFAQLNTGNIVGDWGNDVIWRFHADGRLTSTTIESPLEFAGDRLALNVGVDGFVTADTFANGKSIDFTGDNMTVILSADNLQSERWLVTQGELRLESNGHQVSTEKFLIGDGATLSIVGDAINSFSRVTLGEDATSGNILLDMQEADFANKNWLMDFAGAVTLSNGSYDFGEHIVANSLQINSGAEAVIDIAGEWSFELKGSGSLVAEDTGVSRLAKLDGFSGSLVSHASELSLGSFTAATINMVAGGKLIFEKSGFYNTLIQGASHIVTAPTVGMIKLNLGNGYSGILENHASRLILSGTHNLSRFDWEADNSTLVLESRANISNSHTGVRDIAGMNIQFGSQAQLNEQQMQVRILEGAASISGTGTYRVGAMAFSMTDQATLNLAAGNTLHIMGEQLTPGVGASTGSFQLSGGNYATELKIAGHLISEAGISNGYGNGAITVSAGGMLELRRGAIYSSLSAGASLINIESGATLMLGHQLDEIDYADTTRSSYLGINMASGSTLAASGVGTVSAHSSLTWATGGDFTLRADEDQLFIINSTITDGNFDITGAGIVQLNDVDSDNITVRSGATLHLHDGESSMQSIHVDGGTLALTKAQQADYAITGDASATLRIAAGTEEQVRVSNIANFNGEVAIDSNGYLYLDSSLSASSKLSMESNAHLELAANRHITNTDQTTRTGNYTVTLGDNSSLTEQAVSYDLQSGDLLQINGTGSYSAKSTSLTSSSLVITGGSTSISENSTSQGTSSISIAPGASLSYDQALSVNTGTLAVTLGDGASLQSGSISVASGASIELSGDGSFGTTSGSLTIEGSVSSSASITLGGDVYLQGSTALLDLSSGGIVTGTIYQQGGNLNLGSRLTLTNQIVNTGGSLNFANDTIFDISNLQGGVTVGETLTYTIFTGSSSAIFDSFGSDNIVGGNSADFDWEFNADGTMIGTLSSGVLTLSSGSSINLVDGAVGFEYGREYINNVTLNIRDLDASLVLGQSGLIVERLFIEGVALDIQSNGHQLDAQNIVLDQNAQLELTGAALSADSRIREGQGVSESHVILNMEGGELSSQSWFTDYAGSVELQNGSYQLSTMNHESTQINADATLHVNDVSNVTLALKGTGVISSSISDTVTFSDLTDFSGRLEAVASTINLNSSTAAQITVASSSTVNLSNGSTYSGVINGAGVIQGVSSGTSTITQLLDYRGTLQVGAGTLVLGGNSTSISSMSFANGGTLELLENTIISTNTSGRRNNNFTIDLAAGAVLTESNVTLRPHQGDITVKGAGTYSVSGISLSNQNSLTNLHVLEDATFHITGTNHYQSGHGNGSFQLTCWGHKSTVNIDGTLISNAGISNRDSEAYINVRDGGTLELRVGAIYNPNENNRESFINVNEGGTLILGNQVSIAGLAASTDFGTDVEGKLTITLANEATLAGYGTGNVSIYHTFVTTADSTLNILSQEGQDLHLTKNLGDINAVIKGDGRVSVYHTEATKNFSVESVDLNFQQATSALESFHVKGDAYLSIGAAASARSVIIGTGELMTQQLSMSHDTVNSQLSIDNSVKSLSIGDETSAVILSNKGGMNIDARDEAFDMSMTKTAFINTKITNASITSDSTVSLNASQLVNTDLSQVHFNALSGVNIMDGGTVGEGVRFGIDADAAGSIRFTNTHFSSPEEAMFYLEKEGSVSLKDLVTLDNSSTTISLADPPESITLDGKNIDLYRVDGLAYLLDSATIENQFFIDLTDITLDELQSGGAYGIVLTDITESYTNLVFRVEGTVITLPTQTDYKGETAYYSIVIPEPSTVTLSILSLAGLLARRRRRVEN